MGLEREDRLDDTDSEHFRPVRLGPQDLRDIAAVYKKLDASMERPTLRGGTSFRVLDHRTNDIEDVLNFQDADTLTSIHVLSGYPLLSLHVSPGLTTMTRLSAPRSDSERRAIEEAEEKLRRILRSRQVGPIEAFRQRGPGKWQLIALLFVPVVAMVVASILLGGQMTGDAKERAVALVFWSALVPVIVLLGGRQRDPIRLRGREGPWWERRKGVIVLMTIASPFVVLALERWLD